MILTHITPNFFPQIDGLGDYSRLLARQLKEDFGFASRFIVGDPSWRAAPDDAPGRPPFPAEPVGARSADLLLAALGETETLVLQYVCYGFHPRGVPFWINQAVRRWKAQSPSRRLVVVFHELWASGPPWKSECYLGPVQKHLVKELHHLADASITSVPVQFRRLEAIRPGKTTFQPIPSNLPLLSAGQWEPHRGGPVRAIIFGQGATRIKAVRTHGALLRALQAANLLEEVRVVGKAAAGGAHPSEDVAVLRSLVPRARIEIVSDVTPEQGAEQLSRAHLFLSYYPSAYLCKSGALMAALGCGCVPVLPEALNAAPLLDGRELLSCDGSAPQIGRIERLVRDGSLAPIALAGWEWNNTHAALPVVARTFRDALEGSRKDPAALLGFRP